MAAPVPAQFPPRFPAGGPERYVTRPELAEMMGVSIDTVDRLVSDGMPSVTWGRRTRRFRASVAIAWTAARERTP
jgi:phage terminase Nu1 subunit (DNA packaging protein)